MSSDRHDEPGGARHRPWYAAPDPVEDQRVPMEPELESELEVVLREAEAAAASLRRELAQQRMLRRQHEEVERLDEHFAESKVRWEEIRDFVDDALRELRGEPPRSGEAGHDAGAADAEGGGSEPGRG